MNFWKSIEDTALARRDLTFPAISWDPESKPFIAYRQDEAHNFYVPWYYGGSSEPVVKPVVELVVGSAPVGSSHTSLQFAGTLQSNKFQPQALEALLQYFKCQETSPKGGILVLPCGYGKTVVACALIAALSVQTLVIVMNRGHQSQWCERIQQFLPKARVLALSGRRGGMAFDSSDVVVGTIQSLCRHDYPGLNDYPLVFIDEVHHIAARTFIQALPRIRPRYLVGLSATPVRGDGRTALLQYCIGPIIFRPVLAATTGTVPLATVRLVRVSRGISNLRPPRTRTRARYHPAAYSKQEQQHSRCVERNWALAWEIGRALLQERRLLVVCDLLQHIERLVHGYIWAWESQIQYQWANGLWDSVTHMVQTELGDHTWSLWSTQVHWADWEPFSSWTLQDVQHRYSVIAASSGSLVDSKPFPDTHASKFPPIGYYLGGRKQVRARQEANQYQLVMASATMAKEGLDMPDRDTLVLTGRYNATAHEQALGRIFRGSINDGDTDITPVIQRLIIHMWDDAVPEWNASLRTSLALYHTKRFIIEQVMY